MNAITEIDYNAAILATAQSYIGVAEWKGPASNPAIERMWTVAGFTGKHTDDEYWCAIFVCYVMVKCGLPSPGTALARDFLKLGKPVDPSAARPGDIYVEWRGSQKGWQGHVGIIESIDTNSVTIISGNDSNQVKRSTRSMDRMLGIRRLDGIKPTPLTTLRPGNTAPATKIAQMQADLAMLGYFAGKVDGLYGPLTRNAVMAFQADNDLVVNGIADPKTQTALLNAKPRPVRDVTEADLRERGSRTIKTADTAQAGTAALTVGSAITTALDKAESVTQGLDAATGLLDRLQAIALAYWPVLAVLAVGAFIWFKMRDIRSFRVGDARSGANIGR